MILYELEELRTSLAEEKRKNAELARRVENTEEAKLNALNALHDLIDRLPGALPRESTGEDEDSEGRLIPYVIRLSPEERLSGALAYTRDRDEALKEIMKVIVEADADDIARGALNRIPTPREIEDFEKRTKAEIARVQRQSRVDQAELMKVQEACLKTGMPAGVTYRTWIAELQRKIDTLRKDTEHASEVFTGIREVIGPEPAIVEWVREAREKIDTAPPANTAREDRSAICELGDLLLSGTKDCYAASAVVRMVKHLLTKPEVVEAIKEAHETSWEWVLGKKAPRNTYVDFAVADDEVVEKSVTVPVEMINTAWERFVAHKLADGRARWRRAVLRDNPSLPLLRLRRMIRGAFLARK